MSFQSIGAVVLGTDVQCIFIQDTLVPSIIYSRNWSCDFKQSLLYGSPFHTFTPICHTRLQITGAKKIYTVAVQPCLR
jgi:hypothetical protein